MCCKKEVRKLFFRLVNLGVLFFALFSSFLFAGTMEFDSLVVYLENTIYNYGLDGEGTSLEKVTRFFVPHAYLQGDYRINRLSKIVLKLDLKEYDKKPNDIDYEGRQLAVEYFYYESKSGVDGNVFQVGQISTIWTGFSRSEWDHPSQEDSLLQKVSPFADRGVNFFWTVDKKWSYAFSVIGGEGPDVRNLDNRYNLETKVSYNFSQYIAASVGGGTGFKALAGDRVGESQQDWDEVARSDFSVISIVYNDWGKKFSYTAFSGVLDKDQFYLRSRGLALVCYYEILPNIDFVFRQEEYDPDILMGGDKEFETISGIAFRSYTNSYLEISQKSSVLEARGTAINSVQIQMILEI